MWVRTLTMNMTDEEFARCCILALFLALPSNTLSMFKINEFY